MSTLARLIEAAKTATTSKDDQAIVQELCYLHSDEEWVRNLVRSAQTAQTTADEYDIVQYLAYCKA